MLCMLSGLLMAGGCQSIESPIYKGITHTSIQSVSLQEAVLKTDVQYYNPNNVALDIKETSLQIYVNDKYVGIADQPNTTRIPAKADFLFPIITHFNALKILGTAFTALFGKTIQVQIQGHAKIGKGGVFIKIPVNITEKVNVYTQ